MYINYRVVSAFSVIVNLHDFLELRARRRSLGRVLGVVAVRTQASKISSSPVSYISESVVTPPIDDILPFRLSFLLLLSVNQRD